MWPMWQESPTGNAFFLSVLVTFPYHPPIIVGDYSMVANDISISQNGGYPKHPKPTSFHAKMI